jgi:peptide deformylase
MGLLKILKYGHPLLRDKAFDVKALDRLTSELIEAMAETMYAARGIGLAATQVGVMQRLFVLDVDHDRDAEDPMSTRNLQVFINPEIVAESEEDEPYTEGCLSIPGMEGEVYRPSVIKIVARDQNFEPIETEIGEMAARVFQHERDHLDGVLFVDKLALIKRSLVAGQLNKMKRETLAELPELSDKYPIKG